MLYLWLTPYKDDFALFNVLRYPLFRTMAAFLTAMLICMVFGPRFIAWLKSVKAGQPIRDDGPQSHQVKSGTPTMGGLLMICGIVVGVLLFGDLTSRWVLSGLGILITFAAVGFIDDFAKLRQKNSAGLPGKVRLVIEFGAALVMLAVLIRYFGFQTNISFPFIKQLNPDVGWAYLAFGAVVIVGTANAVNLTDGLDGLAIGPAIVSGGTFLLLAYGAGVVVGGFNIAEYLHIPHVPGMEELTVLCGALCGAGFGFLWYNAHPAQMFMGDVGSLAIGGLLGTLAVLTKNEIISVIIHGVFLVETLSVIIQVVYFKYTRKRYGKGERAFLMAPLHHHFELKGWHENKVIVRFWIISVMLAVSALATLKLR